MSRYLGGAAFAARSFRRLAPVGVVLVVGALLATAHATDTLGPFETMTFVVVGTGTLLATAVGVRRHRPVRAWSWRLVAAALVLFLAGGATREALGTLGDLSADRSLLPDLLTLPAYFLLGLGLIGLAGVRRHPGERHLDLVLDGVMVSLAALTLGWVFFMTPVLFHEAAPQQVRLVLAAYPPMSVFLVAIAIRLAFGSGVRQTPAHASILAAMGFLLVGDVLYMLADAHLAVLPRRVIDVPYVLAYTALAATALHPSMRTLGERPYREALSPTRPRLAFVALALAVPSVVTATRQDALLGDRIVLASLILALTGTAVWRMLVALGAHAQAEARLVHQATHDVLTGLPNREATSAFISRALARSAGRDGRRLALLFLDVDRFKLVNDTFGHSLGDELLVGVAQRLRRTVRPRGFVSRIGGDEFVVVLEDVAEVAPVVEMAEAVRASFHAPFSIRGAEVYSSASLGVAFADPADPAVDAESLIRDADTAMYQAKATGRDGVAFFDASMRRRAAERLAIEQDLRHALERDELSLHFQPIVTFPGGPVDGVEALLRWSHPGRGSVPPNTFVPIAEDTGLIIEIGAWALREACRQVGEWRRTVAGAVALHVAVNLSARQLRDPALVETVERALSDHGLPADALWLELTESVLMESPGAAAGTFSRLRAIGVRLSIDDFGTGYSSLAYLRRFPVDRVKIDREFVEGLDRPDSSDETLVAAILAMGGALSLTAIAEGVETADQERRLAFLGCTLGQGYLYSPPVPPEQVPDVLARLSCSGHLTMAGESV
jgi:diguanylate cyclase (GGDEF)-like protein